jgi:hypothetical protein
VEYYCFYGLLGFRKDGEVGEVVFCKVGFNGFEIRHAFGDDSVSVSCVTELKVGFDHILQLLLQLNPDLFSPSGLLEAAYLLS